MPVDLLGGVTGCRRCRVCFFKCSIIGCLFQEKQARIASLYLPLYGLILDNMPRFFLRDLFPIYFTSSDQVRVDDVRRNDWLTPPPQHWFIFIVLALVPVSYDNGDSSQHNLRNISVTLGKHHDFKPCHFNNKTSPLISLVKHELYIRFLSLFLPQTDFCTILCSTNSSVVLICQVCCDLLDATDVVSAMVDYNGTLTVYFHCEIGMDAVVKLCLKFWQSLQLVNKMEAGDESFLFSPPSALLPGLPWWPQCGRRSDFCNTPRQLGRCLLFQRSTQLHHR